MTPSSTPTRLRWTLGAALILGLGAAAHAQPAPETAAPPELVAPELESFVAAEYPAAALAAGKVATVPLEILVDTTGKSAEVRVVTPVGDGFDEAAVAAARAFTWRPGRLGESAVNVRVRYDYHFELPAAPDVPPATAPGPTGRSVLAGVVRERGTRAPLADAELAISPAGPAGAGREGAPIVTATTDDKGAFRAAGLPAGDYRVTVVAAGHTRRTFDESLKDGESLEVKYLLEPTDANPYRTSVEGDRPRVEIERRSATGDEARRIPGTRGDALRVVESFPGVARPTFGLGLLVVRGSNPEASTSYIAGHQLPLIYHFGGLTSIVNSDLLERIDFLPGNFSSRFGRATGGVVMADLRQPRRDRWGGYISISPLDTSLLLEGPVAKGSLAIAARRSYIDVILNAVLPSDTDIGLTVAPAYWDYQAIFDTPALGGRLTFTALGSSDRLELLLKKPSDVDPAVRGTLAQTTYIQRLIATYQSKPGPRTSLYASIAQGVTAITVDIGAAFSVVLTQYPLSYRLEVEHRPAAWAKLTLGAEGQLYPFHVKARGARPPAEGEVPTPTSVQEQLVQDTDDWELRQGVYAEAALRAGKVTLTPGVRFDSYRLIGDVSLDPRLTATWDIGDGRLRGGFGRYSRMVEEYQSDTVFGNPNLTPEHSLHASLGYDQQLGPGVRVESTLFGKWLYDQAVRSDAIVTRPDGSQGPVGYLNEGVGRVFGLELLVRGVVGPMTGWLSYTLSRADRRDTPGGPTRLFSFDQTHSLTFLGGVRLPWKLLVGGRFRYVTGNPTTPIIGSIYDADSDSYTPIAGAINSERLDAYHELDLRIERAWLFDSWKFTAWLDIQNVYSRRNPEGYSYSYDSRQRELIAGLPVLPSFGVKGEF